jgi:Holliday junction resolvase-like predicted endonuclease
MRRVSILNKQTALRGKELGTLGEALARRYLARAGFHDLMDLNTVRANFPFADVVATRNGTTYAISVKTRNKYETRTGNLNARYKLGKKCEEMAAHAVKHTRAVPAWLAIQVNDDLVSVYFGTLEMLRGSKGISMTPDALGDYECIAKDEAHGCEVAHLKNTYELCKPASEPD